MTSLHTSHVRDDRLSWYSTMPFQFQKSRSIKWAGRRTSNCEETSRLPYIVRLYYRTPRYATKAFPRPRKHTKPPTDQVTTVNCPCACYEGIWESGGKAPSIRITRSVYQMSGSLSRPDHLIPYRFQLKCDGTRWRREGKWSGNWRMEWVASTPHTTSEHGVSSITTADAHTLAASSRLNWRPRRFKWTRPFRWKTKYDFCACAITFQLASPNWMGHRVGLDAFGKT